MKDKMTVAEICSRMVTVGYASLALNEAGRLMRARHVGCLVGIEEAAVGESVAVMAQQLQAVAAAVAAATSHERTAPA